MIRKFFGNGDVFIHAIGETKLKGKTYQKGDQIAYFSNVPVALEYTLDHKQAVTSKRELSFVERHPQVLNIGSVPNTKELEKIFFESGKEETTLFSIVDRYENIKNQTIYLKRNESPVKVKMFSKNGEVEGVLNNDNTISLESDVKEVDVISTFERIGSKRGFEKPNLGYVSIKATIIGSVDGEEKVFILDVPLADLISEPQMDLTLESNYGVSLSFALINESRNKPTVVEINGAS